MRYLARLLALALVCASASVSRAATLEEINIMGWVVGAYSDNRTGAFSHCATSVPYKSGVTLFFYLGRNFTWSMGLHNPRWRHPPGRTFDLTFHIDGGPRMRARANVTRLGLVSIPLADSRALFENFRRGRRLFVLDSRERFTFNLTNSSKALDATLGCVQRYVSSPGGRAPSAGSPPPSYRPAPDYYRPDDRGQPGYRGPPDSRRPPEPRGPPYDRGPGSRPPPEGDRI